MQINTARLLADLRSLATIGAHKGGVHRPTFSDDDMRARHWLVERLTEAGLEAGIDGIGNVWGRDPRPGRKILLGSHIESQNHAGWLDGAMGVVYALEVARSLAEQGQGGVDVMAFCDEEGHFDSFIGSRSFIGDYTEAEADAAADFTTGESLRAALVRTGLAGRPLARVEPSRHRAFLEAHIEQGQVLETTGRRIGVVTGIVAIWQYRIVVEGVQNHAGTTPMHLRADAGMGMVKLMARIDAAFAAIARPETVWTAGAMQFEPASKSIIPGRAEAMFQFRDADVALLERLHAVLAETCAAIGPELRCKVVLEQLGASRPALSSPVIQDALEAAAEARAPGSSLRMQSGAGHDAQWLARKMPSGMVFVPSIGGISHHWTEDTADADIALGAEVYADAVEALLARPEI